MIKNDVDLLKEQLKNGKPIYFWKIPKTCDDEDYSKLILDYAAFKVLKNNDDNFPEERDL